MNHDSSRDPSSEGFTEQSGTIPQTSAPPEVPTAQNPRRLPSQPESLQIEIEDHSSPEKSVIDSQVEAHSAKFTPEISQPYADGPTGTVMAPTGASNPLTVPTFFHKPKTPTESDGERFTIIREVAKGGMGQVSKAIDRELDREVALKEIQPRYAYDHSVAARFVLEARVTGKLEHPGIVPVYGLNHYPDGRPYYAMRFITGESLQDAIKAFHQTEEPKLNPQEQALALRKLLKRFIDVCNTIAFAHSRGFLHRDLKPANIMLGPYGETLVVDWGLAKDTAAPPRRPQASPTAVIPTLAMNRSLPDTQQQTVAPGDDSLAYQITQTKLPNLDSGSDSYQGTVVQSINNDSVAYDATRTGMGVNPVSSATPPGTNDSELTELGRAMGTPSYMAPEQADGRWDDVKPQADIYSLGATLYSILCGKPPFRGEAYAILEKVKRGEITPIEEHKKNLPKALVAIAYKAMALVPSERYANALDLANDVERWMADEPIAIYREPWTVRLARWGRRHRTFMLASATVILTALVSITIGYLQVAAEQKRTAEAKGQTDEAYGRLKVEEEKVRNSFLELQEKEKRVREARTVAERSRESARDALLALTDDAIGEILTSQHAATGKQKQFLENVVAMYHRFIQESTTEDSQYFVAGAHFRVGRLQFKLGNHTEADQAYQRVFELAKEKSTPEWKQLYGETLIYSGIQKMVISALPQAEESFRSARQIFFDLIIADDNVGKVSKTEYWYRLGQSEDRLGLVLYIRGQLEEAEAWFRTSLSNRQMLLTREPDNLDYQFRIAQSLRQIAMVCNSNGRRLEALESATKARDICTEILKKDPTSAVYLVQLADIDSFLTIVTADQRLAGGQSLKLDSARPVGEDKKAGTNQKPIAKLPARSVAARHADNAVLNWSRLVNLYPSDVGYRQQLAVANLNLSVTEQAAGRTKAAANALAATTLVLDDLERRFAVDGTTTQLRGRTAHAQAVNHREEGNLEAAQKAARTAIAHAEMLRNERPNNPRTINDLAYYQIELATILLLEEQLVPAEKMLGEAWINTERSAQSPGMSPSDSNVWSNVRGYARTYADLLSALHRYDQVPVVAKRIESLTRWPDAMRFETACLFGRSAILATRDPALDATDKNQIAGDLANEALDRLQDLEQGFQWLNQIRFDPDLLAVRSLRDYPIVIQQFREPAPPVREKP